MRGLKLLWATAIKRIGKLPLAAALLAVTVLGVGVAYATIPNEDGVIHGCYQESTGLLRVIDDASDTCRSAETALSWNQKGQPGEDGATWHTGAGAPDAALGVDGDFYLDTDTGDVYVKAEGEGTWDLSTNIIGPEGPQGEQGPPGPEGASDGFVAEGFVHMPEDGFATVTSLSLPTGHYMVSASLTVSIGSEAAETFFTCFLQAEDDDGITRGAEAIADLEANTPNSRRSLAMTDGLSLATDGIIELKCQDLAGPGETSRGTVTVAHLTAVEVSTLTEQ